MRFMLPIFMLSFIIELSFQASAQSVNPFNQYMSPSGGVNLYTGGGYTSFPLSTGIPLSLSYSSNVTTNALCGNDIAPTSWCGLGWQLSYESIICDHKGTATSTDDDYMWISPEGVPSKLLRPHKIKYRYYESTTPWDKLPDDFSLLLPVKTGYSDYFNINTHSADRTIHAVDRTENYGYVFENGSEF